MNDDFREYRGRRMEAGIQAALDPAILALEYQLNDGVQCEHAHRPGTCPCSLNVTHLIGGCFGRVVICSAAAGYSQRRLESGQYKCEQCGRRLDDCWVLTEWG